MTTSEPTSDRAPRTSSEKLFALLDEGLPQLRIAMRGAGTAERAVGAALSTVLPFIEPRLRAELIARSPDEVDAMLERAALAILTLRSDTATAVAVTVDAGELELLRRRVEWCQEHHATGAVEDGE